MPMRGSTGDLMKLPDMLKTRRATLHAKAAPSKDGLVEFTASTPSVDRAGDVIDPVWDLKAFERNPVILWAHDYTAYPIGRAKRVWTEGGNLKIAVQFVPEDIYPEADRVRKLYEAGFLSAVSVGFRPLEEPQRLPNGGYRIPKSELLEVSAVPVPMNAEALITSKGANMRPVWSEKVKRDPLVGASPDRIKAWLKEGPKMEAIDVAALAEALGTVSVNPNGAATITAKATETSNGAAAPAFIYVKADPPTPPPAADTAPAKPDHGAQLSEAMKLLTPVDGKIDQAAYDQAMKLLQSISDEMGGQKPDQPPRDQQPADQPPPPQKALMEAMHELTQAINGLKQNSAIALATDLEDPLVEAFANPEALRQFGQQLG